MSGAETRAQLFWRLVEGALEQGSLTKGTIMGRPCVRRDDDFVAMPHSKTGGLIVKLDRERVQKLIDDGSGQEFAPAGRVFKEWLLVPDAAEGVWSQLIAEATERAGG